MKKIGILTAMDIERDQLSKTLGNPLKTDLYGNISINKYISYGKEVYLAKSGVGEIMASACTQLLITVYGVDIVINYGFAGGYNYKMGDTVIIDGLVHYDFDISGLEGCKPGHYNNLFPSPVIETDSALSELAYSTGGMLRGICASADKFVTDSAVKEKLYNDYGATVYEMESAGVLITCKNSGIPALIIKIISDSGDANEYYAFKDLVINAKAQFINFVGIILTKIQ